MFKCYKQFSGSILTKYSRTNLFQPKLVRIFMFGVVYTIIKLFRIGKREDNSRSTHSTVCISNTCCSRFTRAFLTEGRVARAFIISDTPSQTHTIDTYRVTYSWTGAAVSILQNILDIAKTAKTHITQLIKLYYETQLVPGLTTH